MLRWDLATDRVSMGQWLVGRIYEERCDLSPDGNLLVYFARKSRSELVTFTALCRPPYFTALALWPDGAGYGGGGFFDGNRRLILNYTRRMKEINDYVGVPSHFEIGHLAASGERHPNVANELTSSKPNPRGEHWLLERVASARDDPYGPSVVKRYRILDQEKGEAAALSLGPLDWADWDHDGSLLMAKGGCLLRGPRPNQRGRGGYPTDPPPTLVADLRNLVLTPMKPPEEALRWP